MDATGGFTIPTIPDVIIYITSVQSFSINLFHAYFIVQLHFLSAVLDFQNLVTVSDIRTTRDLAGLPLTRFPLPVVQRSTA